MNPLELIEAKRKHLARFANQGGASGEARVLLEKEHWIPRPKGASLKLLLAALADSGVKIKGSSFDAIALPAEKPVDFSDPSSIRAVLHDMTFIEIKTANQERVREGFTGFFFALTEGEIMASELLGERHRVALYNKLSGELLITSVSEILSRTKSMNWQLSVQL